MECQLGSYDLHLQQSWYIGHLGHSVPQDAGFEKSIELLGNSGSNVFSRSNAATQKRFCQNLDRPVRPPAQHGTLA